MPQRIFSPTSTHHPQEVHHQFQQQLQQQQQQLLQHQELQEQAKQQEEEHLHQQIQEQQDDKRLDHAWHDRERELWEEVRHTLRESSASLKNVVSGHFEQLEQTFVGHLTRGAIGDGSVGKDRNEHDEDLDQLTPLSPRVGVGCARAETSTSDGMDSSTDDRLSSYLPGRLPLSCPSPTQRPSRPTSRMQMAGRPAIHHRDTPPNVLQTPELEKGVSEKKLETFISEKKSEVDSDSSSDVTDEEIGNPIKEFKKIKFSRMGALRWFTSTVIVGNCIFIGLQTDYLLTPPPHLHDEMWRTIGKFFTVYFAIELFVRIIVERWKFVYGQEWMWNLFDSLLVLQSIVDWLMESFGFFKHGMPSFNVTRILRIFRFVKILRLVRIMKTFHSFRVMVYSIMHSMLSLLWVLLLLFVVIYTFAIFFLFGIVDFVESRGGEYNVELLEAYGSMQKALLSLFMAISGGKDWSELMTPLYNLHWFYSIVFLFYIFFTLFGVLNVVTSTFVDSAYQVSQKDRDIMIQQEAAHEKRYTRNMKNFFHEADKDGSGLLSWNEFDEYLKDPDVKAYFSALELDVSQARALFMLLDVDDTNEIGIDEFVEGCMHLKGSAKSIDVHMILLENERLIAKLSTFMALTESQMAAICGKLLVDFQGTTSAHVSSKRTKVARERRSTLLEGFDQNGSHQRLENAAQQVLCMEEVL
eukprot:TRINITY_DN80_c0_g1_i2.p1 TRINITY_DN80_c0_g1~~TRINITY_DN80_c0_g1_i2.p1  ORF type:complete len:784 (-),score=171.80 TRINITY_DN80_c0_g1_i2:322-2406(-)